MNPGLRITILTTRDLIRLGLQAALAGLPMTVHFTESIDVSHPADVIILDATGTSNDGARELETLTENQHAPVIVLTSRAAPVAFGYWVDAVHGFLTVSATREEIITAVALALRDSVVARAARVVADPETSSGLTSREIDMLTGIAAGKSNAEIAAGLFLGMNTVKTYIRSAYRRAGVTSRSQAVLWALDHGLGTDGIAVIKNDSDGRWLIGADPS